MVGTAQLSVSATSLQLGPTVTAAAGTSGTVVGEVGTFRAEASGTVVGEASLGAAAVAHHSCQTSRAQFYFEHSQGRAPYPAGATSHTFEDLRHQCSG